MRSRFLSAAEEEFSDSAAFYENSEQGLGEEFVFTILNGVDRLTKYPLLESPRDAEFALSR